MAREGAVVVGVDTDQARLDALVAAIAAAGGRAHAHCADALDPAQVEAVVAAAARQFGGIDILVNAVGGSTVITRPSATVDELQLRRLAEADRLQPARARSCSPMRSCR